MLLSVCIVTYNHEAFIAECLESVLCQETDFDFEIRVGEDASTDSTAEILRRFEKLHPNRLTVVYRTENIGAEKNFDDIVLGSQSEYVAFLEGDNYWNDPHKLQRQVDFMRAQANLSFCFHKTQIVSSQGDLLDRYVPQSDFPEISGVSDMLAGLHCPVALGSMVVRKQYLDDMRLWVSGLKLGDWPMCILLADIAPVGFLDHSMSIQREHKGGAWSRLPPATRALYVADMFLHIKPFATEAIRGRLDQIANDNIDWAAGQIKNDAGPSPADIDQVLASCGNEELTRRVLVHALEQLHHAFGQMQHLQDTCSSQLTFIDELKAASDWHQGRSETFEAMAEDLRRTVTELESKQIKSRINRLIGR